MIFENLDVVVSFAMIMLLLSLLITTLVQMIVALTGLRGRNQLWALEQLLEQAAPGLVKEGRDGTRKLARELLSHPVLATSKNRLLWLAEKIPGWEDRFGGGKRLPTQVSLKEIHLALNSLEGREDLGKAAQAAVADLVASKAERVSPAVEGVTTHVKASLSRLDAWYDTVMNSTKERFKLRSRWVTAGAAACLAFGLQVDSLQLLQQLSIDDELRAQILAELPAVTAAYEKQKADAATRADPEPQQEGVQEGLQEEGNEAENEEEGDPGELQTTAEVEAFDEVKNLLSQVEKSGLDIVHPMGWSEYWASLTTRKFWGMAMTALLLSLGAPFWYGTLGKLVGFRSGAGRARGGEADDEVPGTAQ